MNAEYISLPAGARKHIRREKARIRREFLDSEDRAERIEKLYAKFTHVSPDNTANEKRVEKAMADEKKATPKAASSDKPKSAGNKQAPKKKTASKKQTKATL
ncbi:MAG: hypothetical protein WD850_00445 [Candidatus Spechtbacterales bacterium]